MTTPNINTMSPLCLHQQQPNQQTQCCQAAQMTPVHHLGKVRLFYGFIITSTKWFLLSFTNCPFLGFLFFAINVTHPWSMPHTATASFCLQGSNLFCSHTAIATVSNNMTPTTATSATTAATSHNTTKMQHPHQQPLLPPPLPCHIAPPTGL
jgi:hypothetical protein